MAQTVDRQVDLRISEGVLWAPPAPNDCRLFPPPPRARPPDKGIPLSVSGSLGGSQPRFRPQSVFHLPVEVSQTC